MEEKVDERYCPLDETKYKEKGKCICKISRGLMGTGFFSKIDYEGKAIPVDSASPKTR